MIVEPETRSVSSKTLEIEALSSAFASFVKVTEELRSSYERLRLRAEQIDLELATTNDRLRDKVAELDHLSGHLDGILASVPTGVVVSDLEQRIIRMNAAAEKILGQSSACCLGKRVHEIVDAEGKAFLLGHQQNTSPSTMPRERKGENGSRMVLGGGIAWIRDKEGRVVGHAEIVEDLSEIWELRGRIYQLDKLAALGEMSAVIAHEIRNPLNAAHGFADLLEKKLSVQDPKLAAYARNIVKAMRAVDQIIQDLLLFASQDNFTSRSLDLNQVIEQAKDTAQHSGANENTRFLLPMAETPIRVPGDALKLTQVFRNLFSNALEAMPQGGQILVETRVQGKQVTVRVQDQGPGIPDAIRQKVFEPFFTTKTHGTGLGLAIVRKWVELHGGMITVQSSNLGTCFEITLPMETQ